jgi:branched-chain amino acid transport system permease protein
MSNTIPSTHRRFNLGRWVIWSLFALLLAVAPLLFSGGLGLTVLSQMGIAIIACLSYNMLLGQGGMLSFGHAVYTGLGAFVAIHALNAVSGGSLPIPVSAVPLVGGFAGMGFAALFGYVTTRKSGTTFAMITLGLGELVFAMSLMIPEFFGGEGGVSGNRVTGSPFMGITYGPAIQVYYLIAIYTFISVVAMFAFTGTPLGRMLNAVRDNPERVEFVGYNTQRIRYTAFIIAGFFAGISGGLGALNFEIVTAEVVHAARSGAYLLFTFLGGATFFFGPIIGGVLMVLAFVLFSEFTKAWLLYLGLIFLFMVMYAPGGIASLIMMNLRVAMYGKLRGLALNYLALAVTGLIALTGAAAMIEMTYHLQLSSSQGPDIAFMGLLLNTTGLETWLGAAVILAIGLVLFEIARRRFAQKWEGIQAFIEKQVNKEDAQ